MGQEPHCSSAVGDQPPALPQPFPPGHGPPCWGGTDPSTDFVAWSRTCLVPVDLCCNHEAVSKPGHTHYAHWTWSWPADGLPSLSLDLSCHHNLPDDLLIKPGCYQPSEAVGQALTNEVPVLPAGSSFLAPPALGSSQPGQPVSVLCSAEFCSGAWAEGFFCIPGKCPDSLGCWLFSFVEVLHFC